MLCINLVKEGIFPKASSFNTIDTQLNIRIRNSTVSALFQRLIYWQVFGRQLTSLAIRNSYFTYVKHARLIEYSNTKISVKEGCRSKMRIADGIKRISTSWKEQYYHHNLNHIILLTSNNDNIILDLLRANEGLFSSESVVVRPASIVICLDLCCRWPLWCTH